MKVQWTETALEHLSAIHQYISATSTWYADRMVERIFERGAQLEAFPKSGHLVPESDRTDIRELLEHPFRIIYRNGEESVEVLAVIHVRREGLGGLD